VDPLSGCRVTRLSECGLNTRAVTPSNIHATIYQVLGIDPKFQLLEPGGRPVNLLDDPESIAELF